MLDGLPAPPKPAQSDGQIEMGIDIIRIEDQGLPVMGDGFLKVSLIQQQQHKWQRHHHQNRKGISPPYAEGVFKKF